MYNSTVARVVAVPTARPVHYLAATYDPELVAAILVPDLDQVRIDEFDLEELRLVSRAVIDLRAGEGNLRVLEHLVGRGFLKLADVLAAAESFAAGVPIRDMSHSEQDVVHLLLNLGEARRACGRHDG